MREARRQLAASPVLIGAVTVLVAIVAVFVTYNANQGLPFVPTYKLNAELPNAAKLVVGNEVRAGGFRVGVVDGITSVRREIAGKERSIALLELKLDKQIEPLSVDTRVGVRPRSALGLKYVELLPGTSKRTFESGATVPLRNATSTAPELEDVLSSFPPRTRAGARQALLGFGDALAGRGAADQRDDRRAATVLRLPDSGDAQPLEPAQRVAQPGPGAGCRRLGGGAGGRGPGAPVRRAR